MSPDDPERQAVHDSISQLAAIRLRCELLLRAPTLTGDDVRDNLEQIHGLADGAQALLTPLLADNR